jgi:mRNA interferase RelE/StbE
LNREVIWRRRARDDLAAITRQDQRTAQRIFAAVHQLAEHNIGDVKKLAGEAGEYRLRVGDWRVLFSFEDHGQTVLLLRILNRRDAYR